jgi:hypothetical protein
MNGLADSIPDSELRIANSGIGRRLTMDHEEARSVRKDGAGFVLYEVDSG